MTLDELKYAVKSLMDELECPICLNTLHSPVGQCSNGHLVCNECHRKMSGCPTCKEDLHSRQIKMLDKMYEMFPRKCKHSGCQEIVKSGDDHEKWCGYQETTCKLYECDWTGRCRDLLEHIKGVHPTQHICSQKEIIKMKSNNTSKSNVSKEKFSEFDAVVAYEQFFWLEAKQKKQEEYLQIGFYMIPNGKVNHSFKIKITWKNKNKSMSNAMTLPAESWLYFGKEKEIFSWPGSNLREVLNSDEESFLEFEIKKSK